MTILELAKCISPPKLNIILKLKKFVIDKNLLCRVLKSRRRIFLTLYEINQGYYVKLNGSPSKLWKSTGKSLDIGQAPLKEDFSEEKSILISQFK